MRMETHWTREFPANKLCDENLNVASMALLHVKFRRTISQLRTRNEPENYDR